MGQWWPRVAMGGHSGPGRGARSQLPASLEAGLWLGSGGQGWPWVATVAQAGEPGVSCQPHWRLALGWAVVAMGGHGWPQCLTQARHQLPALLEAGPGLGKGGQGWPQWPREGSQESAASLTGGWPWAGQWWPRVAMGGHSGPGRGARSQLPASLEAGPGLGSGDQGWPWVATVAQAGEPGVSCQPHWRLALGW